MAASLLLRQGRAGALKTVLEARVFRGLAATVSLSAESGKNEKGLPPNPKKQSPPKSDTIRPVDAGVVSTRHLGTGVAATDYHGKLPLSPREDSRNENMGKPVADGLLKAEGDLEDQLPIKHLKPAPVHHKDALDEKTTGLQLEEKDEVMEDSATPVEGRDHSQGPAQAAASAEPFDNSTYKNLQHHDYSTYTFLDLNLDLLKFRMPQPSSGRESPRH
ncbi:NADH dehydrogenase [ubiquinone] flavoprotein 3; mitochondrial [Camelus dromedarius]|uniref:NADH dehydrogenase [ubiquinone] flavoprotein 3 n=1 Tax=Camelus dromedarius TaxID=9838 RepID=A0A5N4EI49_CAMDR|nr:NADH dehydrogenase [ubiquinone] flavoprotein 3; mitochondrial [Camelus dromedarius]KAB1283035.1 NADH dehydrogenase [ubiquinone] flavoprotein 3; mitochondrial [Camelus dromedarius]